MGRRWLVTGCSSGLGRAVAAAAAAAGDSVLATARKPAALHDLQRRYPDRIATAALDVCDPGQCEAAVAHAVDRLGGVDVLVNNAGTGLFGAVEEVSDQELREQLETLAIGPWRLARLVLPLMRSQGSGHIVNVSSVVGRMALPGLAAYVTAKHALEGMSQALAAEVGGLGIRVTVLEPGQFASRYGSSLAEARSRVAAYDPVTGPVREALRGMEGNADLGDPDRFAEVVLRIVAADRTPLRVPVGPDAYAYLGASDEAHREDFETARTFTLGAS
ncbi:SDR family oxidoreductase [Actinacidiphila paucisporea]|uniref:Short-chain dehydrogenase n=1 Tax=Actinacidiphila paucisporea TaxID=310782 RepID=A0A1M7NZQ8_9ACTN|nr:SDR family oxidoreductase [Actinacidiphila paucisporea]SHN09587.1 Short-chain dehydrogenase [Actinacidiphila paucisporea]